ncbi:pre-rRNA 2'-O-ribose RNA methyltransferase FTSJ3 [Anopheles stephensi]|nr:pre-rRNA 2'-O-ribose RNA methyltransferase FTSJ3 [Anopheles stephensi]
MGKKAKVGKDRRDKFYKLAKESGYRSRAAFKLIQLNRRFGFLQQSQVCIDLCAAPGGWMQVAKQNMPVSSIVIGVDLYPIKSVPGCISLIGDITSDKTKSDLAKELKTWKADVILNDGAPNVGKNWLHDAYQQVCLTLSAVKLATQFLRPGGWFITKVFRSKDYNALIWVLKQLFRKVHATKPSASRKESAEIFVVCQYYKAPDKIDPRFLDSKYVFEELDMQASDISSSNILKDLERKTPKKAKVEGYDSTDVRKIVTALEFMQNDKPLALLSRITEITFTAGDEAIAKHPRTTTELKECCKDIKILGRKDIKELLRWHKLLSPEFAKPSEETSDDAQKKGGAKDEDETDVDEDIVELKQIEKEIAALREEDERSSKRKRKKTNKERAKLNEKLSLKMVIKGDEGPTEQGEDAIFSLKDIGNKRQLESMLDQAPDIVVEEEEKPADDEGIVKGRYVRYDRETKGDLFEDDKLLAAGSDSEPETDSDFDEKGLAIESDEEELSFEEDEDNVDPSDDEDQNPLISDLDYRSKTDKRLQRAQLWYEQEAFKKHNLETNDEEVDYDLDKLIESYKKAGVKVLGAEKDAKNKEPLGKKARRRARHDTDKKDDDSAENDTSSSDSDSDGEEEPLEKKIGTMVHKTVETVGGKDGSGFEIVSSEKVRKAKKIKLNEEELALGQMLITGKKMRRDIIDSAFNRYMFNDVNLPDWFVADELNTMKRKLPVPEDVVDSYRKSKDEFNVRTIKKVMEAKARKKRHATKRLEKIKKKAETIMDNADNTNQEKIRLLKKLYKKADAKKKEVTYVVAKKTGISGKKVRRPKGVEGRFKVVDPRMKKDRRADVAKEKRAKKFGKGKNRVNAKAKAGSKGRKKKGL